MLVKRIGLGGLLVLMTLVVGSCSGSRGDDDDDNGIGGSGGNGTGGAGGSGTGGAGTGLALGSFCVKIGIQAERCETTGNDALRTVTGGNMTIDIKHGSSFTCSAPSNFRISTTIPDPTTLPYSIMRGECQFALPSPSCGWRGGAAVSGTIYQTAARVEGELTFPGSPVYEGCPSLDACAPAVDARFRFNLAL
jgi:hypothetical protein